MADAQRSRPRAWTFRILAIFVLPSLLLLGLETALRLGGFGHDPDFTRSCESGQQSGAWCDNPQFTWRFFPPRIARTPRSFRFPKARSSSSLRIFVVGGSAAQGDPAPSYGFSRILELLLRDRYPGTEFEVINTAITAVNSHVVRQVVADLVHRQPDLFIVYLGNNEVVGPYGPGSRFSSASRSLTLVRLSLFLRGTRLGQLMDRVAARWADPSMETEQWRGMEFFLERRVRRDDPRMGPVYRQFRDNLAAMVRGARKSGADVMLSTVATNLLDAPPFASLHPPQLAERELELWQRAFEKGLAAEQTGGLAEADSAWSDAAMIDPDFAELQYRRGRLALAQLRNDEGRKALVAARDLDALRFRADSTINETIRKLAGAVEGVRLVEAQSALDRVSAAGIAGSDLFYDHVHMNLAGNYHLAIALLEQLAALMPQPTRSGLLRETPLSLEECADRLAFTDFDRFRVLTEMFQRYQRPPFSGAPDNAARLARIEAQLVDLQGSGNSGSDAAWASSRLAYRQAIDRRPEDPWLRFNYANLLAELGEHGAATTELRAFLGRLPQDIQGRERLAASLAEQGLLQDAVEECRIVIARAPHLSACYYTLGYALANLGRLDEALGTYRLLLEVDPAAWETLYNETGRILVHQGRLDEAIETYDLALQRAARTPGSITPDLHFNYAVALRLKGETAAARAGFATAAGQYDAEIEGAGASPTLLLASGQAWMEAGDATAGLQRFRSALELDPLLLPAHLQVVRSLESLGRHEAALEAGQAGIEALQRAGRTAEAVQLGQFIAPH